MNILVTINKNYIPPLCVMLCSLLKNNQGEEINLYIIHSQLEQGDFDYIKTTVLGDYNLINKKVEADFLADAPVNFHFSKEMYYRIFASELLPQTVEKALYLDPDMIILNSLKPLYNMDIADYFFAAAKSPNPITQLDFKRRLNMGEDQEYFNSGVLLMNISLLRKEQNLEQVMDYIKENSDILLLPDQDVLNALYNSRTFILDPAIYNFDARYYNIIKMLYPNKLSLKWMEQNTVVLHYCGKSKPWHEDYKGKLKKYYDEYHQVVFKSFPPTSAEKISDKIAFKRKAKAYKLK